MAEVSCRRRSAGNVALNDWLWEPCLKAVDRHDEFVLHGVMCVIFDVETEIFIRGYKRYSRKRGHCDRAAAQDVAARGANHGPQPRTRTQYLFIIPSPQQDDMTTEQHNSCVFTSDDEESVSEFSPFFSSLPSTLKISQPPFSNSNGTDRSSSPGAFSLSNFDWDVNNHANDLATAGAAPAMQHESESSTKINDVPLFPSGGNHIPSSEDHNGASSCPGGMQPPLTVQRNVYPSSELAQLPPVPVHHHYLAAANTTINNVDNNNGMMSSLLPSHPQANTTAALWNTADTQTAQLHAQLFQAQADCAAMQQQLSAFVAENSLSSIVEAVNLSSVNSVASLLTSNNNTALGAGFSFCNQQQQMQQLDHQ
eukprot:scaffold5852_cov68-Skeletonema_dohrnii-CCMP3373.AAC.6